MIERVESETTLTLIRMPKPEKADLEQSKNSLNSDDQIDGLTFTHPEAETNTAHEQENLIYNDEPNTMAHQAQAPQTYKRESEKEAETTFVLVAPVVSIKNVVGQLA